MASEAFPRDRVLAIGLDGFEISLAERFMDEGKMPNLASLRSRSVRLQLDHGRDKYSGLAWEHVSSGRAPSDGGRWSAVTFCPDDYGVWQHPTSARPFLAGLESSTVIFDVPYLDLSQTPRTLGLTHWGAHDPGVTPAERPAGLRRELEQVVGAYPASEWIYGFTWPSPERARACGAALARAVDVRRRAAQWMLAKRLPDWDLALVVVSEAHSAIEPLWHGIDPAHPLNQIPSADIAADGVHRVYRAIDELIGALSGEFSDATVALFAMHGMGANDADVPSMVLLPELLYRRAFGSPYLRLPRWVNHTSSGVPLLAENDKWEAIMRGAVPQPPTSLARRVVNAWQRRPSSTVPLEWMPATRYQGFWPRMPAFALPSFYDGRVRINLTGREARGIVPREKYEETCEEISELLRACRDVLTGEPVVDAIYRNHSDPWQVGSSEADLYVVWRGLPVGFESPFGTIGPVPYRRTGGHTGASGFLYLTGDGILPRDAGAASSFDVVPTLIDLLGKKRLAGLSGASLMRHLVAAP